MSRVLKSISFIFHYIYISCPRHPVNIQSYSQIMIRVSNHLLSIVFRFHYHSQEVSLDP